MRKGEYLKEQVSAFHTECRAVTDRTASTDHRAIEPVRVLFQVGLDQGHA